MTPTHAEHSAPRAIARGASPQRTPLRSHGTVLLLLGMVLFGIIAVPSFASQANLLRILQSQAFVGIAAIGMTYVVLSGSLADLSIPAVIALTANVLLVFLPEDVGPAVVLAFGLPVLIGLANGALVGSLRLNPVIATLGVATVIRGGLLIWTGGRTSSGRSDDFEALGNLRVFDIPIATIVFACLLIAMAVVLSRTRFGYYVRLVGANRSAAGIVGSRPNLIIVLCFVLSAMFASLTGLFLGAFAGVAQNSIGTGYEFDALAAVVIGGNSLRGGTGSLWRTLLGVLIVGVAANLMLLLGLSSDLQLVLKGAIFVTAVALDAAQSSGEPR